MYVNGVLFCYDDFLSVLLWLSGCYNSLHFHLKIVKWCVLQLLNSGLQKLLKLSEFCVFWEMLTSANNIAINVLVKRWPKECFSPHVFRVAFLTRYGLHFGLEPVPNLRYFSKTTITAQKNVWALLWGLGACSPRKFWKWRFSNWQRLHFRQHFIGNLCLDNNVSMGYLTTFKFLH